MPRNLWQASITSEPYTSLDAMHTQMAYLTFTLLYFAGHAGNPEEVVSMEENTKPARIFKLPMTWYQYSSPLLDVETFALNVHQQTSPILISSDFVADNLNNFCVIPAFYYNYRE